MRRTQIYALPAVLVVVLALLGCGNIVHLTQARYPELLDTTTVDIIDATEFSRTDFERTLGDYEIIARYHKLIPEHSDQDAALATETEKAKRTARMLGGNVVMYTRDSETIATIKQDGRYAGPAEPEAVVFYIMRKPS